MSTVATTKFIVSIEPATKRRLEKLAKAAGRSSASLVSGAIGEYLDVNEAQISGLEDAMVSLDRGKTVPQSRVREWVHSWGSSKGRPAPVPSTI